MILEEFITDTTWVKIGNINLLKHNLPTTDLFGPKAQIQADSGGTVKFARAHWDSPYFPKIPPLGILKHYNNKHFY